MSNNDIFGRIAQNVGDKLSSVSQGPEELQRTVQGAMRSAFDRLDLVSREDFDIMMDVLTRTRSRVEALEARLAELESQLAADKSSVSTEAGSSDQPND
ncbi:accessory factor UbiK family protein [Carnimonas nigrificans]|uniref:accessory factor UbiK family protein n=1 Tax=Carnimonas nigrificans TaxID=64323 RepID=UPI0004727CA3|nr:accessory factor UbiK family protein [Carnimonas nigrificans]